MSPIGPGGACQEGWEQVLQNFRAQAALKMGGEGGEVTPENIRVLTGQDIAVVHNLEKGRTDVKGRVEADDTDAVAPAPRQIAQTPGGLKVLDASGQAFPLRPHSVGNLTSS